MIRLFFLAYALTALVGVTAGHIQAQVEYALTMACVLAWLAAFASVLVPLRVYSLLAWRRAWRHSERLQGNVPPRTCPRMPKDWKG